MQALSTTKLSSKGQVVIPEEVRKHLGLKAGAQFVVVGEHFVALSVGSWGRDLDRLYDTFDMMTDS